MKNLFTSILSYIKENWKSGLAPFVSAILGGGIVALTGCSSLQPTDKTQSMSVYALGVPGIAVITSSSLTADNAGADTNAAKQANPVTTDASLTR